MYLINVVTYLLKYFVDIDDCPDYAALSHRWGATEDELTFQEIEHITERTLQKLGWQKLVRSCEAAKNLKCDWVWIDTCCIDKKSNAELQEAINSMWNVYSKAAVCMAYLNDVQYSPMVDEDGFNSTMATDLDILDGQAFPNWLVEQSFESSQWFTRGWTLQELLAPRNVVFFAPDWRPFGTRNGLSQMIAHISEIPAETLHFENQSTTSQSANRMRQRANYIRGYSTATKLSWAAKRRTKRIEDQAYSLLGLFNIQMPLLYGEGRTAFERLQKQLLEENGDPTLLLWQDRPDFVPDDGNYSYDGDRPTSLFAESPANFANVLSFPLYNPSRLEHHRWTLTNLGLALTRDVTYYRRGGPRAIVWLGIEALSKGDGPHRYGRTVLELRSLQPASNDDDGSRSNDGVLPNLLFRDCTSEADHEPWLVDWALHVQVSRGFDDGVVIVRRIKPVCVGRRLVVQPDGSRGLDDMLPRRKVQVIIARDP